MNRFTQAVPPNVPNVYPSWFDTSERLLNGAECNSTVRNAMRLAEKVAAMIRQNINHPTTNVRVDGIVGSTGIPKTKNKFKQV